MMRTIDPKIAVQRRRKIRVVGKIGSLGASSSSSSSSSFSSRTRDECCWISVVKSEEGSCAELFFKGQEEAATPSRKYSYNLDWCYEQQESVDDIFLEEVKPLIPKIFLGSDTSVIEFGARCSEKPPLTKGSEEKSDLALLAITEILSSCKKNESIVKISCYGIHQEHVFDLLEEGEERKEVHVLENAHGKIQLKGLNQVTLESISDFNNVYHHRYKQQRMSKKESIDVTSITQGMIIFVYTPKKESIERLTGRMHFIDLSGYVDTKQKIKIKSNILESSAAKMNKTLFALQNVICALNVNDVHVPYRESKLTHLLKDFTSKDMSHILMVAYLTLSPSQESIQAVKVASRSCLMSNNRRISACSSSNRKPPLSSLVKKHGGSRFSSSKEPSGTATRNLFCVKNHAAVSIQDNKPLSADIVTTDPLLSKEDKSLPSARMGIHDDFLNCVLDKSFSSDIATTEPLLSKEENSSRGDHTFEAPVEKQETPLCTHKSSPPPLSVRLQEITNSIKRLCSEPSSSTVSNANKKSFDLMEPKTPGISFSMEIKDNLDTSVFSTPREAFKTRSNEVKNTLSQGLLTYLNSANKEELMELKGIGEKRANFIIELREESPQHFKYISDLREIGLSSKLVKNMVNSVVGDFDL